MVLALAASARRPADRVGTALQAGAVGLAGQAGAVDTLQVRPALAAGRAADGIRPALPFAAHGLARSTLSLLVAALARRAVTAWRSADRIETTLPQVALRLTRLALAFAARLVGRAVPTGDTAHWVRPTLQALARGVSGALRFHVRVHNDAVLALLPRAVRVHEDPERHTGSGLHHQRGLQPQVLRVVVASELAGGVPAALADVEHRVVLAATGGDAQRPVLAGHEAVRHLRTTRPAAGTLLQRANADVAAEVLPEPVQECGVVAGMSGTEWLAAPLLVAALVVGTLTTAQATDRIGAAAALLAVRLAHAASPFAALVLAAHAAWLPADGVRTALGLAALGLADTSPLLAAVRRGALSARSAAHRVESAAQTVAVGVLGALGTLGYTALRLTPLAVGTLLVRFALRLGLAAALVSAALVGVAVLVNDTLPQLTDAVSADPALRAVAMLRAWWLLATAVDRIAGAQVPLGATGVDACGRLSRGDAGPVGAALARQAVLGGHARCSRGRLVFGVRTCRQRKRRNDGTRSDSNGREGKGGAERAHRCHLVSGCLST